MVITILYNGEVLIIWSFQLPNLMLQLITTFIIIDQISILEWFLKNGVTLKIRLLKIQLCHHRNKLHLINHIQIENSYLVCIWEFVKKKKEKTLNSQNIIRCYKYLKYKYKKWWKRARVCFIYWESNSNKTQISSRPYFLFFCKCI